MGLLDISGFFTGLIINLLLITLVCYYFKRKYENIESAQMEQAKVLYELLQKQPEEPNKNNESDKIIETNKTNKVIECDNIEYQDDSDDSLESTSDDETIEDTNELIVEQIKEVHIDNENDVTDYNKMSVKYLRDLLSNKGIKTTNKMKKNELISLVTNKKSLIVDLAFEPSEKEIIIEPPNEFNEDNFEIKNNLEIDNRDIFEKDETTKIEINELIE